MIPFSKNNNIIKILNMELGKKDYSNLLEYIELSIGSGRSFSQISDSLISSGWDYNVVEYIFNIEFSNRLEVHKDSKGLTVHSVEPVSLQNVLDNKNVNVDNFVSKDDVKFLINKIKILETRINVLESVPEVNPLPNFEKYNEISEKISDDNLKVAEDIRRVEGDLKVAVQDFNIIKTFESRINVLESVPEADPSINLKKDSEISEVLSDDNLKVTEDIRRVEEDLKVAVKDFNIFSGKLESNDSKLSGFDEKIGIQKDLVGELRGMVMSTDKRIAEFEGDFEKANLIIGDFDPQVLEKRFSLVEKKIDINESNLMKVRDRSELFENSLKEYKDAMKKIKSYDSLFDLLDNLKKKVSEMKDIEKIVERKTGKVEIIFTEFQDKLETLMRVNRKTETYDEMLKDLISDVDQITVKLKTVISKEDFAKKIDNYNSQLEYVKSVVYDLNKIVGGNVKVSDQGFFGFGRKKLDDIDLSGKKIELDGDLEPSNLIDTDKASSNKNQLENSHEPDVFDKEEIIKEIKEASIEEVAIGKTIKKKGRAKKVVKTVSSVTSDDVSINKVKKNSVDNYVEENIEVPLEQKSKTFVKDGKTFIDPDSIEDDNVFTEPEEIKEESYSISSKISKLFGSSKKND